MLRGLHAIDVNTPLVSWSLCGTLAVGIVLTLARLLHTELPPGVLLLEIRVQPRFTFVGGIELTFWRVKAEQDSLFRHVSSARYLAKTLPICIHPAKFVSRIPLL